VLTHPDDSVRSHLSSVAPLREALSASEASVYVTAVAADTAAAILAERFALSGSTGIQACVFPLGLQALLTLSMLVPCQLPGGRSAFACRVMPNHVAHLP
jgi:hypothetical protein